MALLMAGGLEQMIFKVASNPYHSMILAKAGFWKQILTNKAKMPNLVSGKTGIAINRVRLLDDIS